MTAHSDDNNSAEGNEPRALEYFYLAPRPGTIFFSCDFPETRRWSSAFAESKCAACRARDQSKLAGQKLAEGVHNGEGNGDTGKDGGKDGDKDSGKDGDKDGGKARDGM